MTSIDLAGRSVWVSDLKSGKDFRIAYDKLLIATGAVPFRPDIPGIDSGGIFGVNSLQSGIDVLHYLEQDAPKRAVIAGGGYIGLEIAEALVRRGLNVSLVEKAPQVMNTLDPDMGVIVSSAMKGIGISLYLGEAIEGFETAAGQLQAVITDKRTIPADIVILSLGIRPNSDLAHEAGIPLGERGAVKVNDRMQTRFEGVWAAGDCAESFNIVSRKPYYIALGTVANKQGRVAGVNMGGGYATFSGVLGTAVSRICDLEVARTGLQESEIRALGLECVVSRIESQTRAYYYPGSGLITVKLLAERESGRLLGGQIVGSEGAAKRIDVVAMALHAGFMIWEMVNFDLSYAPPFSPAWDPVLKASRRAAEQFK